ncbi:MAG TPA: CU044_5270 family protein, partial [Catenuloplanes sp.]|jgi:hypothetical protein
MSDDVTALRKCWSDVAPPSPDARDRARAALLTRIAQAQPAPAVEKIARPAGRTRGWLLPAWAWRSGTAVLGAAALAVGLVMAGGTDRPAGPSTVGLPPPERSPAAVGTFELAAAYAAAQPFTPPRPDQWTYVKFRALNPGSIARSKGQEPDVTTSFWCRADGRQSATIADNGKLSVTPVDTAPLTVFPPQDYRRLAQLPTDPPRLLRWLEANLPPGGTGEDRNVMTFGMIGAILGQNVLPPAVRAALLRAAALIPGVTESPETVKVGGRVATAVGRVHNGWRREDLLLDADTHEFLGHRAVAIRDHSFVVGGEGRQGPGRPGGPAAKPAGPGGTSAGQTVRVRKGELQYLVTRLASAVVDAPGQTR